MTREAKLGLLVGTGIVILIAIVVGDHLSVVQRRQAPPAPTTDNTPPSLTVTGQPNAGLNAAPANNPLPNIGPGEGHLAPLPGGATPAPLDPGPALDPGSALPAMGTVERQNASGATTIDHRRLADNHTPAGGATAISLFDPPPPAQPGPGTPVTVQGGSGFPLGPGVATPLGPVGPQARTVRVESGDTLERLAARHMGAGRLWPELLKANLDVVKRPQDLKPGMVLKVPHTALRSAPVAPGSGPVVADPTPAGSRTYTVKQGDTLYDIAKIQLGAAARWQELLQANRLLLRGNPQNLRPGMKLVVPAQRAPAPTPRPGVDPTPVVPLDGARGLPPSDVSATSDGRVDGRTILLLDPPATQPAVRSNV